MKKTLKNALVAMLATGLCLSIVGIATADEPSYGEIDVTPEEPTRLSEVTFTVDVTGVNITEVRINVEECIEGMCYPDYQNVSMDYNTEDDTWIGAVTLIHDDTVYGTCWLVIKSNGTWYDFKDSKKEFNVSAGTGNGDINGGDTTNGDDGTNGIPGFELILVVISIVLALSIYKKKRIR